uniref:Gag1-like clamp domain-containing protein n=1 Tax=Kalanchoe fedtschenkoi TaxID=63787 RepID=A0A7N0TA01_KALFE
MMDKFNAKIMSFFRFRGRLWRRKKSELVIIVEDASKQQHGNNLTAKSTHVKDFWSTSNTDMDTKTAPSHVKASPNSIQNQTAESHGGSSSKSTGSQTEFVNHGLILWTQTRQQWVSSGKQSHNRPTQATEPRLSWDTTYDSLLGSDKPFPQAVPLSEMVDFLVDVWEQEGLYD